MVEDKIPPYLPPYLRGQAAQVRMVLENLKAIGGDKLTYSEPRVRQYVGSALVSSTVEATISIGAGPNHWTDWLAMVDCNADGKVGIHLMNRPISEQKLAEIIAILVRKD